MRLEDDVLADELLQRHVVLEGVIAALVPMLDGATEWPLARQALLDLGHAPHAVDDSLRRLLLLHHIEGAGDALVARLERVLRGDDSLPTSILEGARFACQGSGGCCQGYAFGPLTDADVAGLDALDVASAFPHLEPPYLESNEGGRFLRRDDDRCIFLTGERRCGLHAAFGADAKPGFCRLFPLDSFATIEGLRLVDRGTCASFGVSARTGLPLVDDLPRVRPLLRAPALHHPYVIVGHLAWDYGVFLRFTTASTTLIKRNLHNASETLAAVGHLLAALIDATAQCPLEPGQPDATVTSVLAIDATSWYRPAPTAGTHALVELLYALVDALHLAVDGDKIRVAQARELGALLAQTADALATDSPTATSTAVDVDDALRISMRQQLFGRHVLVGGHATAGLVRIAVVQLVALAAARFAAGNRVLTAADLNRGHALAMRVFETGRLDAVFVEHEPRWRVILDSVPRAAQLVVAPTS